MISPARLLAVALGLTAVSVAVSQQGWRSRLLGSDLWGPAKSAETFLASGKIPDHGCLSSLRAYIPPGPNLLLIPGVFLFRDQRLYELPGAALLTLGTLVGLFLLCRLYFGERCAWVSIVIYSVSALGLKFANSLWPRGHPFFTVWFFYFLGRWYIRKSPSSFALALLTWAVGMYYFMELAPLLVAFPIVLIAMRPQISLKAVAGALIASVLLWMPYLRFENQKGYRDLASLISHKTIGAGDHVVSRHPVIDVRSGQPIPMNSPVSRRTMLGTLFSKTMGIMESLVASFMENTSAPGVAGALCALCVLGLGMAIPPMGHWLIRGPWRILLFLLLGAGSICFICARTLLPAMTHYVPEPERVAQLSSVGGNILAFVLVLIFSSMFRRSLIGRTKIEHTKVEQGASPRDVMLFALCFATAWGAIAMLVDRFGDGRRLWWAWPIQLAFIVWFLGSLKRRPALILTLVVFGTLACNQVMLDHFRDWYYNGWSGKDAEVLHLLDVVRALEQPSRTVEVGYLVAFPPWFPAFWRIDEEYRDYKVGTDFDRYLRERWQVNNVRLEDDDGIGANDKYRIIQTDFSHSPAFDFAVLSGIGSSGYEEIARVPGYTLLRVESR